jgi:hypothetical protein
VPTWVWVLLIVGAVVLLVLVVVALLGLERRRGRLEHRFAPESGRTVERGRHGSSVNGRSRFWVPIGC